MCVCVCVCVCVCMCVNNLGRMTLEIVEQAAEDIVYDFHCHPALLAGAC